MAKKSKVNLDPERGKRHKKFRTSVLKMNQEELGEQTGKSQGTISLLDRGQDIPHDMKEYYTENGLNWNWYYSGDGSMLITSVLNVREQNVSYRGMDSLLEGAEHTVVNTALDNFINIMREQIDNYRYIVNAEHFSDDEKIDLYQRLYDRIMRESNILEREF